MKKTSSAQQYFDEAILWNDLLNKLRKILLKAGLQETIKWGGPVYMHAGTNVVGIGGFNSYAGLWFFQGALLKDKKKKLINASEGKTKALRQWRFSSIHDVDEELIQQYVAEAMINAEKGKAVKPDRNKPIALPAELMKEFKNNPKLRNTFESLSLSCKREYTEYVSEAKKVETRLKRVNKIIPMILEKKSLHDRYRK